MHISRRDFLKYCGLTAAAVGLSSTELLRLEEALANPTGPTVLWLQGTSCTGCSMSLLNYVSPTAPTSVADLLINNINLAYHPNLMSLAGQSAAEQARQAYNNGGYILAVEGGIPTAFGGNTCWAWTYNDVEVTFQQAVKDLATRAAGVISIGTCASYGGIPAAKPNPTRIRSVKNITRKNTINIAGCPPHPDWIVYVVAQLLIGNPIPLDRYGRPMAIYGQTVHSACPRRDTDSCLWNKGCRGPGAYANCPVNLWNNGVNWCVNANAPCYACTESTFPGTISLYTPMYNPHGGKDRNCDRCHEDERDEDGGGGGGTGPHSAAFIQANQGNCNSCH
ncbi:MAG: hydrogenase small subunit [Deltaproteobacteria bacterium]|nr:hydrogenase small subunit [Deltaproteobacteria bacterium]